MGDAIESFEVAFPEAALEDLRARLAATRFPEAPFDDDDWTYGTHAGYLRELCAHWRDGFDWRAVEAKLNAWPNVRVHVALDGHEPLALHCLHAQSAEPDAFPLVVTHGWPGSVVEFLGADPLAGRPGGPRWRRA